MSVVGATYIYSGSNNKRESAKKINMTNDYRFLLETPRVTGRRQQKFECPQCGKRKCFVRYVDTHNDCQYVADEVGKCDHQHSCGYHYKPSEYFKDHQWAKEHYRSMPKKAFTPPPQPPFRPLPMEYVVQSHSVQSTFWQWLTTDAGRRLGLTEERLQQVYDDYMIGATPRGHVICWQVDTLQRVHGGHIMQYGADGHRKGYQGWTHIQLIRQGLLPQDWQLYQCLYGEHLLGVHADKHVCLVESEKTALLMALSDPSHLWLATAGSGGLAKEKLACLRGRRVTLFPDSGCYEKWSQRMLLTEGIDYNISTHLEHYPANTDLADLLLSFHATPPPVLT